MWLFRIERLWKTAMTCWGEFPESNIRTDHVLLSIYTIYQLPPVTLSLLFPSPPCPLHPSPPTANNKELDEVTVGGNVCHQIGCVIFGICDANHTGGLPCNPSRYWFLQDKELKHAPKGYSDRLGAGWCFRLRVGSLAAHVTHKSSFCILHA